MNPHRLFAILAISLGLAFAGSSAAWAELAEWNQEDVTQAADALVVAVSDLRAAERREEREPPGGPRASQANFKDTLKSLELAAKRLALQLEEGKGRDETMSVAKRIRSLVRDAQETGRRLMPSAQFTARVGPARAALQAVGVYYFEDQPAE